MKKLLCILITLLTLCALASCSSKKNTNAVSSTAAPTAKPAESIDVDLTKLSGTMVYSEVYNMTTAPDNYIGKTVRMNGQFAIYQATDENGNPVPNQIYFACLIADAAACCSQGIEFTLTGEHSYPDDYPELGSEITVTGTFEVYEENGTQYCRLRNATLDNQSNV